MPKIQENDPMDNVIVFVPTHHNVMSFKLDYSRVYVETIYHNPVIK